MSSVRRATVAAACSVVLTGCSTGSGDTAALPTSTPSAPAKSATATSPPDTSPAVSGEWSDEATATAGFADFLTALKQSGRYLVERQERTNIGGRYIDVNLADVVDVASKRASSTKTFAVSDEALWAEITPEGQTVEETKAHSMQTLVDFSVDPPVSYLTYLGDYGWDGKWFVLNPADIPDDLAPDPDVPAGVDPADLVDALAGVAVGDYTKAVRDVADLDPTNFDSGSRTLSYDVPAEQLAAWVPTELALSLQNAGVDLLSLSATARADITTVPGGIEAVLELDPLLREAAEAVADADFAQYLTSVSIPVTFRIHGLDTDERVDLPAPETLVTEPPTD